MRLSIENHADRRPGAARLAAALVCVCAATALGEPAPADDAEAEPAASESGVVPAPNTVPSSRPPIGGFTSGKEGQPWTLFGDRRGFGEIRFRPRLGMQFRYTVSSAPNASPPDDETSLGFHFRRLRPIFNFAACDEKLRAFFQAETMGGEARILDAWVGYDLTEDLTLRVGRIHLGFSREQTVSVFKQQGTDLSSVGFTVNQNVGNRIEGADVMFTRAPHRVNLVLSEGVGVAGGTYNDRLSAWGTTLRYEHLLIGESFGPFAQFTAPPGTPEGLLLGLAGHAQHLQGRGDRVAFAADLSYQRSGFNALLQGTCHISEDHNMIRPGLAAPEPESAYGVVSHAGVYITDDIEPFVRGEWATTSDDDHPDLEVITAGVNWYIVGQLVKFTADATVAFGGIGPAFDLPINGHLRTPDGDDRFILRAQVQVVF